MFWIHHSYGTVDSMRERQIRYNRWLVISIWDSRNWRRSLCICIQRMVQTAHRLCDPLGTSGRRCCSYQSSDLLFCIFIFWGEGGKREGEGIGKKIIKLKIKSIYLGSGHKKTMFHLYCRRNLYFKSPRLTSLWKGKY